MARSIRNHSFLLAGLLVVLSVTVQGQQIQIESGFEPGSITLSRQTTYKVTIRGSQQSPVGNLPAVDGLSISGNPRVSRSASFINGVPSVRLDISFSAKPRRVGTITVPSWTLSIGGKPHAVPAANLRVLPPNQEDRLREEARQKQESDLRQALFLKLNLPRAYFYDGETILGSIALHVWERLPVTRLDQLPQKTGDAFSQSEINRPIEKRATQNGKNYLVYSWPMALTAVMEGMQQLQYRMTVRVRVRNQRPPSGNPLFNDSFFRDPFFGFGREEAISVTSDKIPIDVRSLPMKGRPASFRGAIGTLVTQATTDATRVTVGDPVRITFTVSGQGNFGVIPAPEIPSRDNLTVGPPAFSFEGDENLKYEGAQRFEYIVTPLRPGRLEIPAIPFAYFDPATKNYIESHGEPHALRVDPGESWVDPTPAEPVASVQEKPAAPAHNLFQTESQPGIWQDSLSSVSVLHTPAFWYAQAAPFLCFGSLLAWRVGQRRAAKNSSTKRIAKLRNEMKAGAKFNDPSGFFRAARGAIRERVGTLVDHERPETLARDEVLAILRQRNAPEEILNEVSEVLEAADAQEFAGDSTRNLPLKDLFARVKYLLKHIPSKP